MIRLTVPLERPPHVQKSDVICCIVIGANQSFNSVWNKEKLIIDPKKIQQYENNT